MSRYKKRTFSGAVCEIEVFNCSESRCPKPKPDPGRIRTEEEKREYNRKKSEKHFVRLVNTNFDHAAFYVTATYSNEWLPSSYDEAAVNLDNYIRRLRRTNPQAKIIAVTGYGKRSGRLHHHLIISGVAEEDILSKWNGGEVIRAEHLREHNFYAGVDYGEDFTALAVYLHAHTRDNVKGRRWKQTKTIQQPREEKPKKIKRCYSENKPPKAPEGFVLQEVRTSEFFGSGYICFKYTRTPKQELEFNKFSQRAKNSAVLNC